MAPWDFENCFGGEVDLRSGGTFDDVLLSFRGLMTNHFSIEGLLKPPAIQSWTQH